MRTHFLIASAAAALLALGAAPSFAQTSGSPGGTPGGSNLTTSPGGPGVTNSTAGPAADPTTGSVPGGSAAIDSAASGNFTVATVSPQAPFGSISVPTPVTDIEGFIKNLSPEQRTELMGRCGVVATDPSRYTAETVNFCSSFRLAQVKAPVTGQ